MKHDLDFRKTDDTFVMIPMRVLRDKRLTAMDVKIYVVILSHDWLLYENGKRKYATERKRKGVVYPSVERIATLAACAESTAYESLKRLRKYQYIDRIRVGKKCNSRTQILPLPSLDNNIHSKTRDLRIMETTPPNNGGVTSEYRRCDLQEMEIHSNTEEDKQKNLIQKKEIQMKGVSYFPDTIEEKIDVDTVATPPQEKRSYTDDSFEKLFIELFSEKKETEEQKESPLFVEERHQSSEEDIAVSEKPHALLERCVPSDITSDKKKENVLKNIVPPKWCDAKLEKEWEEAFAEFDRIKIRR